MSLHPSVTFSAAHCTLEILRVAAGVVVLVFKGHDIGEFGDAPFQELAKDLEANGPLEVFIDAREVPATSVDVSAGWAQWMITHRDRIHRMNILCASRFVELTANFVQRFTEFGPRMRIYTEPAAFDAALRAAAGVH